MIMGENFGKKGKNLDEILAFFSFEPLCNR
jgi:hypothetical protein